MAVREIHTYFEHSDVLRKKSKPVRMVDNAVKLLIRDLKDTLNAHSDGIGLAAPQINVHRRVVVIRLGSREVEYSSLSSPIGFINPKIVYSTDERRDFDGCLSFPGLFGETVRPHYLRIISMDEEGEPFERIYKDFDAVVIHHEIDHLDGILFVDRVESIEDLYQVHQKETGEIVRVPLSDFIFSPHVGK